MSLGFTAVGMSPRTSIPTKQPDAVSSPARFPIWGLILLALLFTVGGAVLVSTFFGATLWNAAIGGILGLVFIVGVEVWLR